MTDRIVVLVRRTCVVVIEKMRRLRRLAVRLIVKTLAGLIVSLIVSRPAFALYIELPNGYVFIPNELLLIGGVAILITVIWAAIAESSKGEHASTVGLPKELRTSEPAEHYDDQAGRARALRRKLDAETELAKSYLEAVRSKAELDDLTEFLSHDKAKRRAQR